MDNDTNSTVIETPEGTIGLPNTSPEAEALAAYTAELVRKIAAGELKLRRRGFLVAKGYEDVADYIKMPRRGTRMSAGYDIFNNTGADIVIQPNSTSDKISTKIESYMNSDEYLSVFVRSGHGFKHSVRLANSTGIIDADYTNEIFIKIRNPNNYQVVIPAGEAIAQAIFQKYLLADDDSDTVGGERTGGFGSTNEKKD